MSCCSFISCLEPRQGYTEFCKGHSYIKEIYYSYKRCERFRNFSGFSRSLVIRKMRTEVLLRTVFSLLLKENLQEDSGHVEVIIRLEYYLAALLSSISREKAEKENPSRYHWVNKSALLWSSEDFSKRRRSFKKRAEMCPLRGLSITNYEMYDQRIFNKLLRILFFISTQLSINLNIILIVLVL